jgi:hypothetical protein
MSGGTLGVLTSSGVDDEADDLREVRRRSASSSLTLLAGLSEEFAVEDAAVEVAVDEGLNDLRWCLFLGMPRTRCVLRRLAVRRPVATKRESRA